MWFLGIDIGTTHLKVVGVLENGEVLAAQRCRTPFSERDGLTFHEGEAIWQALVGLIGDYARHASAAGGLLAGISVGTFGQEESLAVDAQGNQTWPSLAWWQNYAAPSLCADDSAWLDTPEHYAVSGLRLRSNQTPERLSHLRQHHPDRWRKTDKWVDFGSYVMWRLTGNWCVSASQINHSQCFDVRSLKPHGATFERLALEPSLFPRIAETGELCGEISNSALPGVALAPGAAVYVGGHDQIMGAYAVQSTRPTDVFDSIGTSEYLMTISRLYQPEAIAWQLGIDYERSWRAGEFMMGYANPSGKIIQTLSELFFAGDFDRLFQALAMPQGGEGIRVSLAQESGGQGLFTLHDVEAGTSPDSVVCSVLDHIAFHMRHVLAHMCELGAINVQDAVLMGSLFQREEMLAHRSRCWGMPLFVSELAEPVATGAATIAREAWLDRGVSA